MWQSDPERGRQDSWRSPTNRQMRWTMCSHRESKDTPVYPTDPGWKVTTGQYQHWAIDQIRDTDHCFCLLTQLLHRCTNRESWRVASNTRDTYHSRAEILSCQLGKGICIYPKQLWFIVQCTAICWNLLCCVLTILFMDSPISNCEVQSHYSLLGTSLDNHPLKKK